MATLKVITKKPEGKFKVEEVSGASTYDILRTAVDGYIECVRFNNQIDVWINEEGKLIGLEPNVAISQDGKVFDLLMGDIIVTSTDDEGETISLTEEQIRYFMLEIFNTEQEVMTPFGVLPILKLDSK